jgi:hypothetical protein
VPSEPVDRFEDINTDSRAIGIKNDCRVAKADTPAGIDKLSVDVASQPAASEPVELMMVGPTRCKGPVRRQAMEGRVHATPIVSPALIVVHRHVASSTRCLQLGDDALVDRHGSTKAWCTARHEPGHFIWPMIKAAQMLLDQQLC